MGMYSKSVKFSIFLVVLYAYIMKDVAVLTPAFSEQWWAEMWWWTKFLIAYPILGWHLQPIPLTYLKHEHSPLEVIELFPDTDPDAYDKFSQMTAKVKYSEHKFVILRNFWGDIENTWKKLNSSEILREYTDQSQTYSYAEWYENKMRTWRTSNLSMLLDDFEGGYPIKAMQFDYEFLRKQEHLFEEYKKLWKGKHPEMEKSMGYILDQPRTKHHFFLNYGNKFTTPLHGEPLVNYMLQVANSKRWRAIHKRYTPYVGAMISSAPGILLTPYYFTDGYAKKMPFAEFTIHPGDLLYFPTWHYHEVVAVHDDLIGLSLGVRPQAQSHKLREPFKPLKWFEFAIIPWAVASGALFKKEKNTFPAKEACPTGKTDVQVGLNGTHFVRYDYTKVNGECKFYERVPDYQARETMGHLHYESLMPKML